MTFEIVNIDINNTFENYKDITNLNMNYDLSLSDNCEHLIPPKFYDKYRNNITHIKNKFLKEKPAFQMFKGVKIYSLKSVPAKRTYRDIIITITTQLMLTWCIHNNSILITN